MRSFCWMRVVHLLSEKCACGTWHRSPKKIKVWRVAGRRTERSTQLVRCRTLRVLQPTRFRQKMQMWVCVIELNSPVPRYYLCRLHEKASRTCKPCLPMNGIPDWERDFINPAPSSQPLLPHPSFISPV